MNPSHFWINKPVLCTNIHVNFKQLFPQHLLLENITNEINKATLKLNYKQFDYKQLDTTKILSFINQHYVTSDTLRLIYSKNLFVFFTSHSIILEFYLQDSIVGYIIGKPCNLMIQNNPVLSLEVNFLCLAEPYRNMGLASYMINVLSKESLIQFNNISTAHYTISTSIKSPYFSKKNYYHRPLHISKLMNAQFLNKSYNYTPYTTFNIPLDFKNTYTITHLNSNVKSSVIKILYDSYIQYCQKTYEIYNHISFDEFQSSFFNDAFYHFIILDNKGRICSYISLFLITNLNIHNNITFINGHYYYMFFNSDIPFTLELLHEYIYQYQLCDVVSFCDIFNFDYKKIKAIQGSASLKYYLFNMLANVIPNYKNGLITI